uniref:BTB domain-containing protein n=1 Tax=Amphiprion ocellaris TaxID=80972 RepID=A0AAQ5YWJ0_AMPOC
MITTEAAREFQAKERKYKEQLKRCLSSALSADLSRLLQEELEADVSLYAASGSLRAHRAVLLARAPHVLRGQTHKDPIIVHLPDYELSALKDFLRRLYTAEQSMRSVEVIPDVEGSVPESTLPVPNPADLHRSTDSDAVVLEPASGLGADLLDLYQRGEQCDITIQVAEQVFSCHRAILCARSQYFRAMLSGSWMESSRQCITLQGLLLSERQRQTKPFFSSGERRVTRLSFTDLRVTGEDMAVRMESGCADVSGKPLRWPPGCSHVDGVARYMDFVYSILSCVCEPYRRNTHYMLWQTYRR